LILVVYTKKDGNAKLQVFLMLNAVILSDEDDRCYYDTAKNFGAYLVTGNIKHYPDDPWVLTPAEFVKLLDASHLL